MPLYQSSGDMICIFWLLKGKTPKSYNFVKSFLQTSIKFTFLLKVQVSQAEPVKRSHGASSVTVIRIWAFGSLTDLWHINAVQAFRKLRIPTTSFRTYLIKTIPSPLLCLQRLQFHLAFSTNNWKRYLIYMPGDSLKSENNKHGFPIVLIYLLKKLFSQQKEYENATWKSVRINLDLQQRNVEIARTMS